MFYSRPASSVCQAGFRATGFVFPFCPFLVLRACCFSPTTLIFDLDIGSTGSKSKNKERAAEIPILDPPLEGMFILDGFFLHFHGALILSVVRRLATLTSLFVASGIRRLPTNLI